MAEHDVVIRGGTVVDVTGVDHRSADAAGCRRTSCCAVEIHRDCGPTGAPSGRPVRGARAAPTASSTR